MLSLSPSSMAPFVEPRERVAGVESVVNRWIEMAAISYIYIYESINFVSRATNKNSIKFVTLQLEFYPLDHVARLFSFFIDEFREDR